jgi:hypothetical protein
MKPKSRKWIKFIFRWGIAVVGIVYVLMRTSFHDKILIVDRNLNKQEIRIEDGESNTANEYWAFYDGRRQYPIARAQVWTPPGDQRSVPIRGRDGKEVKARVLAIHPTLDQQQNQPPAEILVENPANAAHQIIKPAEVVGGYQVGVPYPLVDIGLIRLVREARPLYLLLAVALLPISFLITSVRWHMLLEAQDIHMGQGRAFVLNMVGSFYNSFMPGSTGGDLVKAYYAAKHTTHRTRAVMTVIIDRILGLLALIILGGVMAAVQ